MREGRKNLVNEKKVTKRTEKEEKKTPTEKGKKNH